MGNYKELPKDKQIDVVQGCLEYNSKQASRYPVTSFWYEFHKLIVDTCDGYISQLKDRSE